jgi:hypothetical protein
VTAQLLGARLVLQRVPEPVADYWPVVGLATNLGTAFGPLLPGTWYVEVNVGRLLLTIAARARR